MSKEMLLEFKSIYDNEDLKYTKVELITNKNTYTDMWEYTSSIDEEERVEHRKYNNNIKNWCSNNNISYIYYFNFS